MTPQDLMDIARDHLGEFPLSEPDLTAGSVAAALLTAAGNVYTGICLDIHCGIGFCAEHAAAAEMLKHHETQIVMVVAVHNKGVLPPCGRCRELFMQLDSRNSECRVVLSEDHTLPLKELLPHGWRAAKAAL
jgi:cytidine deaminase